MIATCIAHWPGKDTPACDSHWIQLVNLAHVMGFGLSCTPLLQDEQTPECTNCANEARKEGIA